MSKTENTATFNGLVDLAAKILGGRTLGCSDDFFAEMENLLKPGRGIFIPDRYTERGKWMDGWESRRRRGGPDHDWCIIELGSQGRIRAFDIDTNHFLGNHPPFGAVDAVAAPGAELQELKSADWEEVLPQSALKPGSQNLFVSHSDKVYTHVRLRIYPDGGVARLRVFGDVESSWRVIEKDPATAALLEEGEFDLAALHNGGRALACSDMFFSPMENLIMPHAATDMGNGWETRRKRHPGHDWIILELASRGTIRMPVVDTFYFKGNFADRFTIEAIDAPNARTTDLLAPDLAWKSLIGETKLNADERKIIQEGVADIGPVTHVRVNIFPDGGLSRLRLYGTPEKP